MFLPLLKKGLNNESGWAAQADKENMPNRTDSAQRAGLYTTPVKISDSFSVNCYRIIATFMTCIRLRKRKDVYI